MTDRDLNVSKLCNSKAAGSSPAGSPAPPENRDGIKTVTACENVSASVDPLEISEGTAFFQF